MMTNETEAACYTGLGITFFILSIIAFVFEAIHGLRFQGMCLLLLFQILGAIYFMKADYCNDKAEKEQPKGEAP